MQRLNLRTCLDSNRMHKHRSLRSLSKPSSQPFARFHGSPMWTLSLDIPEGSRVEYKLEIVRGGHHQLVVDTLHRGGL